MPRRYRSQTTRAPAFSSAQRCYLAGLIFLAALAIGFPLLPWVTDGSLRRLLGLTWPGSHQVLMLLLLALTAALLPRQTPNPLSSPTDSAYLATALGLLLIAEPLLLLALLFATAALPLPELAGLVLPPADAQPALAAVLLLVLGPAVIEEWLFRGRLLPLLAMRLGPASAVTLSALLFALVHGRLAAMLVALPLGLLLGWLRLRCRSWYPCVCLHALHNTLFLLVGTQLLGSVLLPGLLLAGGIWLSIYAWQIHRGGAWRHRRLLLLAVPAVAAILVLLPLLQRLQDRAWTAATSAILGQTRYSDQLLLQRLRLAEARGQLTAERRNRLLAQRANLPAPRGHWLLALLDPGRQQQELAAEPVAGEPREHPAYAAIRSLAAFDDLQMQVQARQLGAAQPPAMATFLRDAPQLLPVLYPLPEQGPSLAALIGSLQGRDRLALLGELCRQSPWPLAAYCLQLITPAQRQPMDAAQLRRYQPQPQPP